MLNFRRRKEYQLLPGRLEILILFLLPLLLLPFYFQSYAESGDLSYHIILEDQEIAHFTDNRAYGEFTLPELPTVIFSFSERGLAIVENNCPDGFCLRQQAIKRPGEKIYCLPKLLILEVRGDEAEYDYVTPVH
ncbi:MAG: NusG domain II-containing protein [Eubacteriales bacterium]|nr:NusG domain II-containing protein [Eubacteriales bacterium]